MIVVKRHKRLWIDDDSGRPVYTTPNFIRVTSRNDMRRLAASMEAQPYIDAVMEFEASAKRSHR